MNGLSLFSGIGGLDLGLERAGITTVGQVEIDPWCQRVLAKHWPDVPRHDDVRTAADWWLGQERPHVDLVFGGFPCQDISNAGRRAGIGGERSGLWSEFHDIVRVLRPRWVLLENVAAILGRGAGRVLGDLAEIGYDAEWDCVPAASVGAPHLRDRWLALAYPAGIRRSHESRVPNRSALVSAIPGASGGVGSGHSAAGIRVLGGTAACSAAPLADAQCEQGSERHHADGVGRWEVAPKQVGLGGGYGADAARSGSPLGAAGLAPAVVNWPQPERCGWWDVEPDVGRVAHGIPSRVDRLRGLGNAVVPQVAEHVGRLIVAADRERAA